MKSAIEVLGDNMSDNLWKFINTYPVALNADKTLKDWIIDAMEEYANQFANKPTDEEIAEWGNEVDVVKMINDPFIITEDDLSPFEWLIFGAKACRDNKIPAKEKKEYHSCNHPEKYRFTDKDGNLRCSSCHGVIG